MTGWIDQAKATIMKAEGMEVPYLRWAEQIAEPLVFVHSKGIKYCRISVSA